MIDFKPKPDYLINQSVPKDSPWETVKALIALAVYLGAMTAVYHIDKL